MNNNRIYLPGLNGLRALAALTISTSHIFQSTFGDWGLSNLKLPLFTDGVTLFFVISGFLITYLLLLELNNTKTIDISKFYIRRILRIWPLYYLYILVVISVLFWIGKESEILNNKLYFYIFFTANIPFISSTGIALIVHYWSIGVEEQFYLFWPWLLKLSINRIIFATLSVLLLWLFLKYGSYILYTNKSFAYKFFNVTRFHCMMIGALGAIGYYRKNKLFFIIFTNKWSQTIAWLVFLFSGFFFDFIPSVIKAECIAMLSLFLIMSQVEGKPKFINLEYKYFDFLGKISYGIYLTHPLIIFLLSGIWTKLHVHIPVFFQYLIIYFSVTFITIFLSWISFEIFEKQFLKLKNRYTIVKSSNSMNVK
jgi:peptidoglycan/LPS O-acetylase OafA/YrhL